MKTKEQAKANLEASVSVIGDRYKAGVSMADWQGAAGSENAEKNFADSMNKAIAAKSRQAGVRKVANADWQRLAAEKGGAVIGERVRAAVEKQAQNWAPVYDAVVAKVKTLAPRSTDFRANVTARVIPVVEAAKRAAGKL